MGVMFPFGVTHYSSPLQPFQAHQNLLTFKEPCKTTLPTKILGKEKTVWKEVNSYNFWKTFAFTLVTSVLESGLI